MVFQILGYSHSILVMPLNAHVEGAQAPEEQYTVGRIKRRHEECPVGTHRLVVLLVFEDGAAGEQVAVSAHVLGATVQ